MSTAEITSAGERAVLERVRTQLEGIPEDVAAVIGIRASGRPEWHGDPRPVLDGRQVRVVACPSVLAVLDAVAGVAAGVITAVYTDRPENELGEAVLARLHKRRLLEANRHTLLRDLLGARSLDPRIQHDPWLMDALIALAGAGALPSASGVTLGRERAIGLVALARLGLDPEQLDLAALIEAFDGNASTRSRWRDLAGGERAGLQAYFAKRLGVAAEVVLALVGKYDDPLAELLVADAIMAAPETESARAAGAFGQSRFTAPRPSAADITSAGRAAATYALATVSPRVDQQVRRADALIEELDARTLAQHSDLLSAGFVERLAAVANTLNEAALARLERHREAALQPHRVERVRAALRLHRWLATEPKPRHATAAEGLADHAGQLAWVDRALTQVRAGDADRRVAAALNGIASRAGAVRTSFDASFASRLAVAAETPTESLCVETFLPEVVAPLAKQHEVLLVVVDGMSGAVAGELADRLTERSGWTEVVRAQDGAREAILAALPTETRYSRSSLFHAALVSGEQAAERAVFASHRLWNGGSVLVHKAGVAGRDGADLGPELETALRSGEGPRVVAVVLNTVDDSLAKGRQAIDPAWTPDEVSGLRQLLERAVIGGRIVIVTSDHGHILEHGSQLRASSGGSRWRRADTGTPKADEVLVSGPRVLVPEGRAVLAATEDLRYGTRAHGYHGGATLAEASVPLIVLLPPGVGAPAGWHGRGVDPDWWTGVVTPPPTPPVLKRRGAAKKPAGQQGDGLFEEESVAQPATSRGTILIRSAAFKTAHQEWPVNRVAPPEVFAAVVDALIASGGRLPVGNVLAAAGARGRTPRGVISAMTRVLNRDNYGVLILTDSDRTVLLDSELLDEQFPVTGT